MTNAIILSAGQGRRLSPLTDNRPKCLVPIGGRTILEWQLLALAANGIDDVTVITGFGAHAVESAIKTMDLPFRAQCLYNPFYSVADNIGSCWEARHLIGEDSVLMNGDTLFETGVLKRVLAEADAPISITMDVKEHYDSDDMKVRVDGDRLTAIGKTLTGRIDGESIGLLRFRDTGGRLFGDTMRAVLDDTGNLKRWYLSIIDDIAKSGAVGTVRLQGERWCEVDFPTDLPLAEATVGAFNLPVGIATGSDLRKTGAC